jgi:hypothetical protein
MSATESFTFEGRKFSYETQLPIFKVESEKLLRAPGWGKEAKALEPCNLALLEKQTEHVDLYPEQLPHIQALLPEGDLARLLRMLKMDPTTQLNEIVMQNLTTWDPKAKEGLEHARNTIKRLDKQLICTHKVASKGADGKHFSVLSICALVLLHKLYKGLNDNVQTWYTGLDLSKQAKDSADTYGLRNLLFAVLMAMVFKMETNDNEYEYQHAALTFPADTGTVEGETVSQMRARLSKHYFQAGQDLFNLETRILGLMWFTQHSITEEDVKEIFSN